MKLYSTNEIIEILGVSESTLVRWRKIGMPHIKVSRSMVRFKLDEVMLWIENKNREEEK